MTRVDLGPTYPSVGWPKISIKPLMASISDPRWNSAGAIVGPGFYPSGRVAVLNEAGEVSRVFGALPPGDSAIPYVVRQEAYRSSIAMSPNREKLVLATRYSDRLDYFDVKGTKLGENARPFSFEPKFSVQKGARGPVMASGDDMRYGYTAVAATERLVFALFSGRTRTGFNQQASFANFLHVYDWSGHLIRVFRLDASVQSLAVADDGSRVYTLRHDPMPSVLVYDLPKL